MFDITPYRWGVLGLARSGLSAARFLHDRGLPVVAVDDAAAPVGAERLRAIGVPVHLGEEANAALESCTAIVVSPGVPRNHRTLQRARQRGALVLGELELAYRLCPVPMAAVSGTKGKSTTVSLLGEMLARGGVACRVGGNIGNPLLDEVLSLTDERLVVAEVSSFQLETTDEFRPRYSVLLNVVADHLDRHVSMEEYVEAKARLLHRQTADDVTVLNADDAAVVQMAQNRPVRCVWFSRRRRQQQGAWLDGDAIRCHLPEFSGVILSAGEVPLPGAHNVSNVMAAALVALLAGADIDGVRDAVRGFHGLPHRLEHVTVVDGVTYINDSMATTPFAAIAAIEALPSPLFLIAGGHPKTDDFDKLGEVIARHRVTPILIGAAAESIAAAAARHGAGEALRCETLQQAVETAHRLAPPGACVALSPACASFDMFDDYAHRGRAFRDAVSALKGASS